MFASVNNNCVDDSGLTRPTYSSCDFDSNVHLFTMEKSTVADSNKRKRTRFE